MERRESGLAPNWWTSRNRHKERQEVSNDKTEAINDIVRSSSEKRLEGPTRKVPSATVSEKYL